MLFDSRSYIQYRDDQGGSALIHIGDHAKVFTICVQNGQEKHCGAAVPPEVTFYVLEGSGKITVGEEDHNVQAGDIVFCPAGKHHAFHSDTRLAVLVVLPLNQN